MDRSVRPELHDPSTLREKSVIGTDPDKIPRMVPRPTLTNDDTPRVDLLPAIDFDAQAFGIGVSSVSCTSLTFCMCHVFLCTAFYLILRDRSAVPLTPKI